MPLGPLRVCPGPTWPVLGQLRPFLGAFQYGNLILLWQAKQEPLISFSGKQLLSPNLGLTGLLLCI